LLYRKWEAAAAAGRVLTAVVDADSAATAVDRAVGVDVGGRVII
jgi:hypothetical protein